MAGTQRDQGPKNNKLSNGSKLLALLRDCMFQAHIVCLVEGLQQSSHDLLQVTRSPSGNKMSQLELRIEFQKHMRVTAQVLKIFKIVNWGNRM
jgi:hypothetical protein